MSKHIVEDLPARKFAPAAPVASKGGDEKKEKGGVEQSIDKKIRQAVYDIRYRARREDVDLKRAFAQYMQNSSLGQAEITEVRAKLFGKDGGGGMKEQYSIGADDWAAESIASAMFKVFVENVEPVLPNYLEELHGLDDKKYKVRVTDKKTGKSYVRYATREKITQLRANPNIQSVEMTEYGEPYEGERKSGEQTAKVKAGKDYDGDGKVESGAKEYRGSVHNAIQRKKGGNPDGQDTSSVKEEFLADGTESTEGQNRSKITGKGVNNYASGAIKISPEDGQTDMKGPTTPKNVYAHTELEGDLLAEKAKSKAQQKFMGMVYAAKKGEMEDPSPEVEAAAKGMSEKEAKKFAKTKHKGLPEKVEEENDCDDTVDDRDKYAKINLIKNKLRSMGMKNPIVMVASSYDPEGEMVDEAKAIGNTRSSDQNPKGAGVRVSSGRGMTMTPARGLGASKPEGDDKKRAARQADQAKKDRRSAAKDRAASGEDRLGRLIRSVQMNNYEPGGEQINERQKYAERYGKKFGTNRSSVEGGNPNIADTNKRIAPARIGGSREKPKVPGEKPPVAGESGSGRQTPESIVALKRARKKLDRKAAQDMYKPRAGESD